MAVLIDPPAWPAQGRLWSHLASDTSFDELHAFAVAAGVPRRAFEGDHYDVPQERYADLVCAGARAVASRDLLRALQRSGLRRPKRKGERVLQAWPEVTDLPRPGCFAVDLLLSPLGPPVAAEAIRGLALRRGAVALVDDDLPAVAPGVGRPVGHLRVRGVGGDRWYLALRRVDVALLAGTPVRWATLDQVRASRVLRCWWPLVERVLLGPPR